MPGVAGRAIHFINEWALREFPDERMFASTLSNNQNVHVFYRKMELAIPTKILFENRIPHRLRKIKEIHLKNSWECVKLNAGGFERCAPTHSRNYPKRR